MTTTDYIGIGILITTFFSAFGQFINSIRIKDIHGLVNGQSNAQNILIAHLTNKVSDKERQISDAHQTAAVLAESIKTSPAALEKLEEIARNTDETVKAVKDKK
jgi:hypothetical protein